MTTRVCFAPCVPADGLEHSTRRFSAEFLRPTTPVPGLYLTGQDTFTDGVAGGALAGLVTASVIDPRTVLRNVDTLVHLARTA
jgi:phytoene dehydrogenase-like protein